DGAPRDLPARLAGAGALRPDAERFSAALARDLLRARGACAVLVGPRQPASVHAAAAALNALLGADGGPGRYGPPPPLRRGAGRHDALGELRDALASDAVEQLVICDVDLAHAAPGELGLRELIGRAHDSLYLGLFEQATARACRMRLHALHALESWADTRAPD